MAVILHLAVLVTSCFFFTPMMTRAASTSGVLFNDVRRDDVIFIDNVIFDKIDVNTPTSCARHCDDADCLAFTFTPQQGLNPGQCRGYNDSFDETSSDVTVQAGAETYMVAIPSGAYMNFIFLDEETRAVSSQLPGGVGASSVLNDAGLALDWYRFLLNGTSAQMPTVCVQPPNCSSLHPVWLDLQGYALPQVGDELQTQACVSGEEDCCLETLPVTVQNTGDSVYLYRLAPPTLQGATYCAVN